MKQKALRRVVDQEPRRRRVLRLSPETIRALGGDELSHAVSGCDTPSLTTEVPQRHSVDLRC